MASYNLASGVCSISCGKLVCSRSLSSAAVVETERKRGSEPSSSSASSLIVGLTSSSSFVGLRRARFLADDESPFSAAGEAEDEADRVRFGAAILDSFDVALSRKARRSDWRCGMVGEDAGSEGIDSERASATTAGVARGRVSV